MSFKNTEIVGPNRKKSGREVHLSIKVVLVLEAVLFRTTVNKKGINVPGYKHVYFFCEVLDILTWGL